MAAHDNEEQFLARIQEHKKLLYKLAYMYCRNPDDRRDLMQEMLIQVWKSYASFDGRVQFSTWMYRVAMNAAISYYRSARHAQHETVSIDEFGIDVAADAHPFDEDSDRMRTLRSLVDQLDEMNRALILLYLDGCSHEDIAAALGISASNVGTRLGRIKDKLKQAMPA